MFPAVIISRLAVVTQRFARSPFARTPLFVIALSGYAVLAAGCAGGSGSDASSSVNTESLSPGTSLRTSSIESSALCPGGGVLLEIGFDTNQNDVLDNDEVQQTQEICHGTDGTNGDDGTDGTSGLNALVRVTDAPASADCPAGGVVVETGLDANGNAELELGEVNDTQTQLICHGSDGEYSAEIGPVSLVETTVEPAGGNCTAGGVRIDSGVDTSRDGILQEIEKSAPVYVCNVVGSAGSASFIDLTAEAPGENCEYGGTRVESGVDTDNNGNLDPGEVSHTRFVCEPQSCLWTDNSDGTTTISCEGEEDRVVLNPEALGFVSRTTCSVSIDHPDGAPATIPLIYTVDVIGESLKFVTLNVLDGEVQVTNSKLVTATTASASEFNFTTISVYFDTYLGATGGRYLASLDEADNEMTLIYFDTELPDGGLLGRTFKAFADSDGAGACSKVVPAAG